MYKISPTIDSKVCNKKVAVDDEYVGIRGSRRGKERFHPEGGEKKSGTWSCVDYEDTDRTLSGDTKLRQSSKELTTARYRAPELGGEQNTLSKRLGDAKESELKRENGPGNCRGISDVIGWTKRDCSGDEPTVRERGDVMDAIEVRWYTGKQTNRGWPGTAEGKINTAQGMAGDLVSNLDSEEKSAVAGILSKTISGAEVVEIRAVSTTSVMLNACYDFRQDDDNTFFPYGCVGVGTSLTSVADGHLSAKLAYKLKVGIDCEITPRMVVYAGGFYHKVLGDNEYYDIPTAHLVNDASPEGRSKNYAKAFFRMAYTGAEIGMRFSL